MTDAFIPTRNAALERLSQFLPDAGRAYAAQRNFDRGAGNHDAVSRLSPYLRCRLITEQEVVESILARHSLSAAEKLVQEVFWRTYWKGWLELRPAVWDQYHTCLTARWNDVQTQSGLRDRWQAACRGETDIDCFNYWAQELHSTGYLHNHARMWFASIWIFTLELPWELGADFFLRHLLDGDPASNTLSWRWVAGIQTPGKTYLARTSNISKFTEGRFHPKWQLASEAPPLAGPEKPDARPLPEMQKAADGIRTGFLWHEDDLSPGFMDDRIKVHSSAVLRPQTAIGPLQPVGQVAAFRSAAQDDAILRYKDRFGSPTELHSAQDILEWASAEGLEQIVTPYAPVGPVASVLNQIEDEHAPRLVRTRREYDSVAWPHATRGFFPFKKKIPELIAATIEKSAV